MSGDAERRHRKEVLRELERRKRVIRQVWLRLMATAFTSSTKRYLELVDEASKIIAKEAARLYELDHPPKKKRRAVKR